MDYEEVLEQDNNVEESSQKKQPVKLDKDGQMAKDAAVTAATMYGGKLGGNLVKAASHTKLGKNVLNTGGKILNGGSNIVSNINRNPLGMMGRNIPSQSNDSSSNQTNIAKDSNNNQKDNNINDIENDSKNSKQNESKNILPFKFFGNKKKMGFFAKMKLYFAIGGIVFFFFSIILFIMVFLDVDMTKMLGTLEWNNEVVDTDNGVSSETDFSSDNSVEIKDNDLLTLIGESKIKEIEDSIKNKVGNNTCTGIGVANSLIALIDGLNKHNLKIPYMENGRCDKGVIIDSSWGSKTDENNNKIVSGLDDKGLVFWAMNVAGINNDETLDFNAIEDFTTLSEITSGDILRGSDLKIVLQNTGSTIKVAEASVDGITYKEYSYQTLSNYSYLSMANFYSVNCTN